MSPRHQLLEQLYLDGAALWRAIAGRVLADPADQRDAVQNAFVKCLKDTTRKFNDFDHARRFVGLAVHHSAIDLARKNTRRLQRFVALDPAALDRWTALRRSGFGSRFGGES